MVLTILFYKLDEFGFWLSHIWITELPVTDYKIDRTTFSNTKKNKARSPQLLAFFELFLWGFRKKKYFCPRIQRMTIMKYTEETLIIDKPSKKLLKAVEELRKHKLEQIERLRNMKPEEFSRRVILS